MASYDLSAAFDCIDATILDKKLEHYGIDTCCRKWIESFLMNRRQFVRVGAARSSCVQLTAGSPQGSILSPLLFLIYLADINEWLSVGSAFSYADDTAAITFGETKEIAIQKLEKTSNEMLQYFASNMLVANATKTTVLVFLTPRSKDSFGHMVNIGGALVMESKSIKLLGINISPDMSWTNQYDSLISSLRSSNGLLSRLSKFAPNKYLTPLIHGLQLSKVRYALPLFCDVRIDDSDVMTSGMRQVQVELNKGLRIILGTSISDRIPIQELVDKVGVPSANQLAAEATLMEMWRHINYCLPAMNNLVLLDDHQVGERERQDGLEKVF